MKRVGLVVIGLVIALAVWLMTGGHRPSVPVGTSTGEPTAIARPGTTPTNTSLPGTAHEATAPTSAATTTPATPHLAVSSSPASVTAPRVVVELVPVPADKPTPPASLTGFWSWPEDQVERIVTGMQSQPDWPADQRQFLRRALRESSLSAVARNNIAAGLMRQEPQILDLHRDFLAMHQRADEDPVWRDYCLQFLAQCVERVQGPERDAILAALVSAIDSDVGALAGTAVLHLARLSESGLATLNQSFDERVTRLATNPTQPEASRSTALAVLGQRGYLPALEKARNLLSGNELPGVKRAAIGVVSLLGTKNDLPLIESLRSDADPSVALVATQASKAMNLRLSHSTSGAN